MTGRNCCFSCVVLAIGALAIAGSADAYTLKILASATSVDIAATAGSDAESFADVGSRQASSLADAVDIDQNGNVAVSVANGQAILVHGGLQIITIARTNVRSRAEAPMTGSAMADVAGSIRFTVEAKASELSLLELRLETKLTLAGSSVGTDGLEGARFVFTLDNLTTHTTLYDSRINGYPDSVIFSGQVGDVFESQLFGSLAIEEASRPYLFGSEIQNTRLFISGGEVPEPGTALLTVFGLAALGRLGRRFSEAA